MGRVDRRIIAANLNTASVVIFTAIHVIERLTVRYDTGLTPKELDHVAVTVEQLKSAVLRIRTIEERCKR